MNTMLVISLVLNLIFSLLFANVAKLKGYSSGKWFLLTFFFSVPAWLAVIGLPEKKKEERKLNFVCFGSTGYKTEGEFLNISGDSIYLLEKDGEIIKWDITKCRAKI